MAATTEGTGSDPAKGPPVVQERKAGRLTWAADFYRSALGKKYAMAISGIVMMGYVFAHMVGNLKVFESPEAINDYAVWLREMAYPALPNHAALMGTRAIVLIALVVHLHAAWALTRINWRARQRYASKRDYVAADFAGRTMRWTGVIILLFIVFHLANLSFGTINPDFEHGDVYGNVVAGFSHPLIAGVYLVANVALGLHLYHGAWSLFQTMGWNNRRFNHWRRYFAIGFAVVVAVGNLSIPIAVLTGVVS